MKINIVRHRVGLGIDKRNLDVIALVHDHQRARDRTVEGHGLKLRPHVVDDNSLLLNREAEFHDLRALLGHLLVRMHEWRRDKLDLLPGQLQILGQCRRCKNERNGRSRAYC